MPATSSGPLSQMAQVALMALQDPKRLAEIAAAAGLPAPTAGGFNPGSGVGDIVAGQPSVLTGGPSLPGGAPPAGAPPAVGGIPPTPPAAGGAPPDQLQLLAALRAVQPQAPTTLAPPRAVRSLAGRGGPQSGNVLAALAAGGGGGGTAPQIPSLGALIAGLS